MEITNEELEKKIENGEKLVVDFYTNWCGPCKMMKPIFEKVSEQFRNENSEVELYTMNIENSRETTIKYGIRGVPTIKSFNGGDVVDSKSGLQTESQINDMVKSLLNG